MANAATFRRQPQRRLQVTAVDIQIARFAEHDKPHGCIFCVIRCCRKLAGQRQASEGS